MLAIFNELGALESFDKEGDLLNQGAVGIVLKAQFKNIKNTDYIASINYTRSDGSKSSKLLMNLDAENENGYIFNFDNEWYFALDGETTFTIFLYDSSEKIIANGQAQFYITKTDYDSSDSTITTEQYDTLLSALKQKINYIDIVDSLGSEETAKPLSANMGRELDVRLGKVETGKANASETNERFASAELRLDNLENSKVDKINNLDGNNPYVLYGAEFNDTETIQKTYPISEDAIERTIARRGISGDLSVGDPITENSATNKKYVNELLNLYVKYSNIDTDFSLTSTNPLQNKVVSKQIKDINYTIMTMKEELFETVLSEIDYKVDYATIYPIPETLTDSDGTHRVVYSDTQLKEVEGNSVAFNQLVKNGNFESESGWYTITSAGSISVSSNVAKVTKTSNAKVYLYRANSDYPTLTNHKYLHKALVRTSNDATLRFTCGNSYMSSQNITANTWTRISFIASPTTFNGFFSNIDDNNTLPVDGYFETKEYNVFDLTLMFGAGNEPTTVEEFNHIFPNDYYPYNAGEIKNTVIKGIKVNRYNLFDGELEQGGIIQGQPINATDNVRSKNFIKVIGGKKYTFEESITSNKWKNRYVIQYDANKNWIKDGAFGNSVNGYGVAYSGTLENNCCYIKIKYYAEQTITPSDFYDICLHLTGSRTGYAPYVKPRIINIPQTELPSAGSVHDTIKFVEGNVVANQQRYNMVHVSRVEDYTFTGSETFVDWGGSGTSLTILIDGAVGKSGNEIANILWTLGSTTYTDNINSSPEYSISMNTTGRLYIATTKTADELASALIGKMVQYEKAEPTETTLATDLTFEEVSAIIEQGGSIETIFENVPPNLKTTFVVNKAIVS